MALLLLGVRAMHSEPAAAQTIGRYHLHRQIARGGMARIHIARALGAGSFSRIVAAKRLDPQLACDDEFVEMFLDEARVASKIRHRNVVPVLDVVTLDGEVIMVQELVHGAPLHKLFSRAQKARTRIPIPIAVSIAAQTLAGLHAAHEAVDETGHALEIVHRDVSPQNIMISTDGSARLLDFGVAKTAAAAHVTRSGTFKGKLAYSSPEQLDGRVTRQTDIYALAVVLWELVVGERMHVGRSEAEVFASIMKSTPPRVSDALAFADLDRDAWRDIQALAPILDKAFARDLADRYATAADMEQALLAAVAPAPLAAVAAWMRTLAQDLVDHTEQLIAEEEASWRRANASGVMLATGTGSRHSVPHQFPRSSTSLETEAAKPSARWRAKLFPSLADGAHPLSARYRVLDRFAKLPAISRLATLPPVALALADAIAVLVIVLLVASPSAPAQRASAAPRPVLSPPAILHMQTAPIASPAPVRLTPPAEPLLSVVETRAVEKPAGAPPAKRKHGVRRTTKRAKPTPAVVKKDDCSLPFYYEGAKKIFKPSCL